MTNYDIFNVEEQDVKLVIVMKTSESPFDYAADIQEQLKNRGFVGTFLIDELLHSGNTDERFIKGFFDGEEFDKGKFTFEQIARRNKIRDFACQYLRSDIDVLNYSCLTERQQKLISHGCLV